MTEVYGGPYALPGRLMRLHPPRQTVRRRVPARPKPAGGFRFDHYRRVLRWTLDGVTFSARPANGNWTITLPDILPPATDEELERQRAEAAEKRRQAELDEMARLEASGRRHRATVDRCLDYILHDVTALHAPDDSGDCTGCDSWEDWPCTTFRLIEAGVNPDAPERSTEKTDEREAAMSS